MLEVYDLCFGPFVERKVNLVRVGYSFVVMDLLSERKILHSCLDRLSLRLVRASQFGILVKQLCQV